MTEDRGQRSEVRGQRLSIADFGLRNAEGGIGTATVVAYTGCLNRARRRTRSRPRNRRRFKNIEDEHEHEDEDEPNVDLNQHPATLI